MFKPIELANNDLENGYLFQVLIKKIEELNGNVNEINQILNNAKDEMNITLDDYISIIKEINRCVSRDEFIRHAEDVEIHLHKSKTLEEQCEYDYHWDDGHNESSLLSLNNYSEPIYEWKNMNLNHEDRTKYFVTAVDKKLIISDGTLPILGVLTSNDKKDIVIVGTALVRDDGTCVPNEYCTSNEHGIATHVDAPAITNTYLVLERVSDNIIKIIMK